MLVWDWDIVGRPTGVCQRDQNGRLHIHCRILGCWVFACQLDYRQVILGSIAAFCNNSDGVIALTDFIIASSTRPAASASDWARPASRVGGLAGPARCVRRRDTCRDNQTLDTADRNDPGRFATLFLSRAAAGGTGNFPDPGTFGTFFPIHFFSASAYRARYRFLAVTGFTTHLSPFIYYSEVLKRASCPHRGTNSAVSQVVLVGQCGIADASVLFTDKSVSAPCPFFATIRAGWLRSLVSSLPAARVRRLRHRTGHGGG